VEAMRKEGGGGRLGLSLTGYFSTGIVLIDV